CRPMAAGSSPTRTRRRCASKRLPRERNSASSRCSTVPVAPCTSRRTASIWRSHWAPSSISANGGRTNPHKPATRDGSDIAAVSAIHLIASDAAAAGHAARNVFDLNVLPSNEITWLRMCDNQQRWRLLQHGGQRVLERLGVEGGKALVQDQDFGALEQGPSDVDTALLAVTESPARVANRRLQTGRHAV